MIADIKPVFKLMMLLGILLVLGLLTAVGSGDDMNINFSPSMITLLKVLQVVAVIFIFVIPSGLFSLLFTKDKLRYPRLHVAPNILLLMLGALVFILGMPLIAWLEHINKQMTLPSSMAGLEHWMQKSEENAGKLTDAFMADTSVGGLLMNLFVIAFMAAFSEELFFRGVLQKSFQEAFKNYHVAVWVTAALFSAFHMQFYGFLPRMVMGAMLGYLFVWSGSLWVNIFAHFINNGVAVLLSWLAKRGTISSELEDGTMVSATLPGLISLVLVASLMFVVYKKRKMETELVVAAPESTNEFP